MQRKQVSKILQAGFPCQPGLRYQPGIDYVSVILDLASLHKEAIEQRHLITEIPPMAIYLACGVNPHGIPMVNGYGMTWKEYLQHTLQLNKGHHIAILPKEGQGQVINSQKRVSSNMKRLLDGLSELLDRYTPAWSLKTPQNLDINLIARRLLENFGVSDCVAAKTINLTSPAYRISFGHC